MDLLGIDVTSLRFGMTPRNSFKTTGTTQANFRFCFPKVR